MIQAVIDHLWQSTLFALLVGLVTLAFKENRANLRFCLWWAASVKFLIPFSLFVTAGRYLRWETVGTTLTGPQLPLIVHHIAQPWAMLTAETVPGPLPIAPIATEPMHWDVAQVLWILWACGLAALLFRWAFQWLQIRSAIRQSSPMEIDAPIAVISTPAHFEPGVFGIFRPVIMLPDGVSALLTSKQLDAILAHELCHWRRRDNLTAAVHMIVEALFWFHPLIWWLGTRLVIERERACDEAVIQAGSDRHIYAEGILKVCKFYVEQTSQFIAGVSGGNLKKRVATIMTDQAPVRLHLTKRLILTVAGCTTFAGPVAAGFAIGPQPLALAQKEKIDDPIVVQRSHIEGLRATGFKALNLTPTDAVGFRAVKLKNFEVHELASAKAPARTTVLTANANAAEEEKSISQLGEVPKQTVTPFIMPAFHLTHPSTPAVTTTLYEDCERSLTQSQLEQKKHDPRFAEFESTKKNLLGELHLKRSD